LTQAAPIRRWKNTLLGRRRPCGDSACLARALRVECRAAGRRLVLGRFASLLAACILSTVAAARHAARTPLEQRS